MSRYYAGSIDDLARVYEFLKNRGLLIYGLSRESDVVKYRYIASVDSLIEYVKRPGDKVPDNSPKSVLHPPDQLIHIVERDFAIKRCENGLEAKLALFPIKPCDLRAKLVVDKLLERDQLYAKRRGSVEYVIVEECSSCFSECFCGSLGTGPTAAEGYDLAYMLVSDSDIVFKPNSEKGLEIVNYLKLERASSEAVDKYKSIIESVAKSTSRAPPPNAISVALEAEMGNIDLWKKLAERCVGCANCTAVCPTCFCSELYDVVDGNRAYRYRRWTGCLAYVYGLTAGYHYRPELYMRFRHFVLHKFLFQRARTGSYGCTGCGRCIAWCPMGVDFVNVYWEVGGRRAE